MSFSVPTSSAWPSAAYGSAEASAAAARLRGVDPSASPLRLPPENRPQSVGVLSPSAHTGEPVSVLLDRFVEALCGPAA